MPAASRICIFFFLLLTRATASGTALEVEIDGKVRISPDTIVLGSAYHDIRFLLPADSLAVYRFRLKGLEKEWQSSVYPLIRYTGLGGGTYTFEGKAIRDGRELSTYSVFLEIRENFWEKWWFWVFIAAILTSAAALALYFWSLYDFRQRLKMLEMRQRIAADLHDEVGANLSSITFIIELLHKQLSGKADHVGLLLEKIRRNSQESASLISDTIWALNPEYDNVEKLSEKMKSFASGILAARDISFDFHIQPGFNPTLSIGQRRDLYLIFKEAINNAARHSEAGSLTVRMLEKAQQIEVTISDDGIGFDPGTEYEGNGLKNYRQRAKTGHVTVAVESAPGKGTTVVIRAGLANHYN